MSSFAAPLMTVHVAPGTRIATPVRVAPPAIAHPTIPGRPVVVPPPPARPAATVAVHPIAVQTAANLATSNPAMLHFQNAVFWPIFNLNRPRSAYALPVLISPGATPTDTMLFEEPQDARKLHFLPGYVIASTGDGTQQVPWVSLEPAGAAYQLVVHLHEKTGPGLASSGHIRIDHPMTRYLLTGTLQGRTVSWDFPTVAPDGETLKLTLPLDHDQRNLVYLAMTDPAAQAKLIVRRSISLAVPTRVAAPPVQPGRPPQPPQQLYNQGQIAIDTAIPFTYDKVLDQEIFAQLDGAGGKPLAPWNILNVNWNGRAYTYYQDRSQPTQIYYLPESFNIARDPHGNRPRLMVAVNGEDVNSVTITLSYVAQPVWTPDRITKAVAELQQRLSPPGPIAVALFEASNATLALKLPPSDPSASVALVPQNGVTIDIAAGIAGSVTLKLDQFRQIYDALFDEISELLSGEVAVTVDDNVSKIPFNARASEFIGDIFQTATTFDPMTNRLTCAVQNAVESPIHVDTLVAALMKNGQPVANTIEQISPSLPLDLAPKRGAKPAAGGGTSAPAPEQPTGVTVTIQLAQGQSIDASTKVMFDYSGAKVVPDRTAMWQAIMQNQVAAPVSRSIVVSLVAAVFVPVSAGAAAAGAGGSGVSAGSSAPTPATPAAATPPAGPPPASAAAGPADSPASAAPGAPSAAAGPADSSAPAPEQDPLLAIQVVFDGGQTATFNAAQTADAAGFLNQTVKLAVPIDAYVLGQQDTGSYHYRVDQITRHGTTQGQWLTNTVSPLFVTVD